MRRDLSIYNEATGFVVTSKGLNGRLKRPFAQDTTDWSDEIARGTLIPISLVQDDSINVRVVLDEDLSEAEREEAYDRFDAVLAVPDGRLLVMGGSEYTEEPSHEYIEEYGKIVKIPPGNYSVTVLTYYHGPNVAIFEENIAEYFTNTRPGKKLPRWIADEDDETNYISFVLHLRIRNHLGPNPIPLSEDGWVPEAVNKQRPAKCPLGLVAKRLTGKTVEQKQVALIYRFRVFEALAGIEMEPVAGSPVAIPIRNIVLPHWIAWMAGETHPELRVTPNGDWNPEWPGFLNGIQETRIGDSWLIEIEGMNARWSPFGHLSIVGALLETLPDGSIVEVGWAGAQPGEEEGDEEEGEPSGIMRLNGVVVQGRWHIEQSYPSFDHSTLISLLAFAEEAHTAEGFKMKDQTERDAIIRHCKQHAFFFKQTPPVADGLNLRSAEPSYNPFLAAHIFAKRFDGIIPIMDWDD